jgi:hypothetical protein
VTARTARTASEEGIRHEHDRFFQPATGDKLKRGMEVVEEILTIKDELVQLDNVKPFDEDRRRGRMEFMPQEVTGRGVGMRNVHFDAGSEVKPLLSMNVAFTRNPGSGNGTFVSTSPGIARTTLDQVAPEHRAAVLDGLCRAIGDEDMEKDLRARLTAC